MQDPSMNFFREEGSPLLGKNSYPQPATPVYWVTVLQPQMLDRHTAG